MSGATVWNRGVIAIILVACVGMLARAQSSLSRSSRSRRPMDHRQRHNGQTAARRARRAEWRWCCRGRDRTGRDAHPDIWPERRSRLATAGWKHGLSDRVAHEGLHGTAAGRHGCARRGRLGETGHTVSAERCQDAAAWTADNAAGSVEALVGPAVHAHQLRAQPTTRTVHSVHPGTTVRIPLDLRGSARTRPAVVFEPRRSAAWTPAGAARQHGIQPFLKARVLEPLGLRSTSVTVGPDQRARLAPGHDRYRQPVDTWELVAMPASGSLRSTANDLLHFLAATLDEH